jgi:cytoskeletal protein CcmA (bactofilin family)
MVIFGEKKPVDQGAFDSIIGEKAKFKGELNTSGAVRVNGEFEGKLSADGEVIVSRGSKIVGDVQGGKVVVSGTVDGNIVSSHSLEITKSGKVHGDLTGGCIVIEEGAAYHGKLKVGSKAEKEDVLLVDKEFVNDEIPSYSESEAVQSKIF